MWNKIVNHSVPAARERSRSGENVPPRPNEAPAQWPNGSGIYRQDTAHKGRESDLLGRTVKRGDKFAAWRMVRGQYMYLGEYGSFLRALRGIAGNEN